MEVVVDGLRIAMTHVPPDTRLREVVRMAADGTVVERFDYAATSEAGTTDRNPLPGSRLVDVAVASLSSPVTGQQLRSPPAGAGRRDAAPGLARVRER